MYVRTLHKRTNSLFTQQVFFLFILLLLTLTNKPRWPVKVDRGRVKHNKKNSTHKTEKNTFLTQRLSIVYYL